MKASSRSIWQPRFRLMGAAVVLALNTGCLSISNHYSAVDISEPVGVVRNATNPMSLPMVLGWVAVALLIGATACWLVLRWRAGRGKPVSTLPPVAPTVVAATATEPAEISDDDFRSEFHEQGVPTLPATAIAPAPPAEVLR